MTDFLVQMITNWADEMDIEAFCVMSANSRKELKRQLKNGYLAQCLTSERCADSSEADKLSDAIEAYSSTEVQQLSISKKLYQQILLQGHYSFSIGTNEEIDFYDFESFKESYIITKLSRKDTERLKALFGNSATRGFGPFHWPYLKVEFTVTE